MSMTARSRSGVAHIICRGSEGVQGGLLTGRPMDRRVRSSNRTYCCGESACARGFTRLFEIKFSWKAARGDWSIRRLISATGSLGHAGRTRRWLRVVCSEVETRTYNCLMRRIRPRLPGGTPARPGSWRCHGMQSTDTISAVLSLA
jgi:hypothetical protein